MERRVNSPAFAAVSPRMNALSMFGCGDYLLGYPSRLNAISGIYAWPLPRQHARVWVRRYRPFVALSPADSMLKAWRSGLAENLHRLRRCAGTNGDRLVALRGRWKQQHWRSHPWSHVIFVVTQRVTGHLATRPRPAGRGPIGHAGAAFQDHHGAQSPDSSAASTGLGQLSADQRSRSRPLPNDQVPPVDDAIIPACYLMGTACG